MRRSPHHFTCTLALGLAVILAMFGSAACGDKSDDKTTTSASTSTTATGSKDEATKRFDEQIQRELEQVGCYKGAVDGILGAESDEAILEFQRAEGLSTDGELGPETEAALKSAVAAGKKVCTASESTTTTAKSSTTRASAGGSAPCTASAIGAAIAPEKVASFQCGGGFASGSDTTPGANGYDAAFLLQASGGAWTQADLDKACAEGNPLGIPQSVLAASPCQVS